jgi:hypothetical protein
MIGSMVAAAGTVLARVLRIFFFISVYEARNTVMVKGKQAAPHQCT